MKRFLILVLSCFSAFAAAQPLKDIRQVIASSDLDYTIPVTGSEEGMPIGNGRMGTLVWTTPSSLKFQINRVDIFGNNAASDSFFERNTDYCSGAGLIDIGLVSWGDDVFTAPAFRQHLSCYDGKVSTDGNGIKTTALVWNDDDVMAVKIEDQRKEPAAIIVSLRMLRDTIVKKGGHTAISRLIQSGDRIILTQKFTEGEYYCGSAVAVAVKGRESRVRRTNDREAQLVIRPGNGPCEIYVSSASTFDKEKDLAKFTGSQLDRALKTGYDIIADGTADRWKEFWERSYVRLHSNDGEADFIQANYNYFMYVMGASSTGAFPPKFNGMIWTTGGDSRKWGNNYWGANQSCMYNGLFPANRMELLEPMFRMYTAMAPSLRMAAIQQWGSKGIYIPETVAFDGLPSMPENIASEMRTLYLSFKPWESRSGAFDDFASTKSPFQSRWNWKQDKGWVSGRWTFTDKGAGPYGHVSHIFSRGAKIAYQYWQKYEFTKDLEWLRENAYPMLRDVAEFYRNYPGVRKEADGKYHIYNVNDNESVRNGHNTVEEISSMMGIFPAAIKASVILGTDQDLRAIWTEFISNLSGLPLNSHYPDLYQPSSPVMFARSLPPVTQGPGSGKPDGNTMPVWFFDLCNLSHENTELFRIANATFDDYFRNGINGKTPVYVLSKLPVTGTMLGRKEAARYLIANQIRTAEIETMPNRMTLREGYQTTGVQNLGRAADALHYALINSSPPGPGRDPSISLFPAWPEEWNADFKLLARGNFLVTSSFRDKKLCYLEIFSQSGGECRLVNPWNSPVNVLRNNGKPVKMKGATLVLKTRKGERIEVRPTTL